MKLKETWRKLAVWQRVAILLRNLSLYAVLLSAPAHIFWDFDNSFLALICLPLSAVSQAVLSWKGNKKLALFFLFAAIFVVVLYSISF